jgi:hypothetical protein
VIGWSGIGGRTLPLGQSTGGRASKYLPAAPLELAEATKAGIRVLIQFRDSSPSRATLTKLYDSVRALGLRATGSRNGGGSVGTGIGGPRVLCDISLPTGVAATGPAKVIRERIERVHMPRAPRRRSECFGNVLLPARSGGIERALRGHFRVVEAQRLGPHRQPNTWGTTATSGGERETAFVASWPASHGILQTMGGAKTRRFRIKYLVAWTLVPAVLGILLSLSPVLRIPKALTPPFIATLGTSGFALGAVILACIERPRFGRIVLALGPLALVFRTPLDRLGASLGLRGLIALNVAIGLGVLAGHLASPPTEHRLGASRD